MATLPDLLKFLVEKDGSDLHIATNTPPQIRVHGHLQRVDGPDLQPADTKQLVYSVLTDAQKKRFEESNELDFSFGIRGLARFRCNVFSQRGAVGAVVSCWSRARPAAASRRRWRRFSTRSTRSVTNTS